MQLIIGLIFFLATIYAIYKTVTSHEKTANKIVWVLIILLLPLIGLVLWIVAGPRK